MKKRSAFLAFGLAMTLVSPRLVLALEGTVSKEEDTLLIPGFVYTNRTATTSGGVVESFTLAVEPSSTAYPIAVQGSGMIYQGGNINRAVSYAESLGYHVMGAINSDYFTLSTGVPTGIVIEDGIYKSSPSDFSSILFNGTETTILGDIQIPITVTNHRTGESMTMYHLNKNRTQTGGLYLLNDDYATTTRTSTEGFMIRMVPTYDEIHGESGGKLTVNSSLSLTVTETIDTDFPWDIEENHYILTSAKGGGYDEFLESYEVGDKVTITTSTWRQELVDAQWATGGGDIMISDGVMTESSSWEHITDGRNPRTAFGVKADGTMVFYAVDGRQSGYSVGLTQRELANHMLEEGCVWAVNLDGGGSTSFSVASESSPNVFTTAELANAPSDGGLRSCATYLLLVDPRLPDHLTLENEVLYMLIQSEVDLGSVVLRDVNRTIVEHSPTESSMESLQNLGVLDSYEDENGFTMYTYTALEPGEETFSFEGYSGVKGEKTLVIVEELTEVFVVEEDTGEVLEELSFRPGEEMNLALIGNLQGEDVFIGDETIFWKLLPGEGVSEDADIGQLGSTGYFIAGDEDCVIVAESGGVSAQVVVSVQKMFDDVPEGHWAYDAIEYLYDKGLISGMSETEYGMGQQIRRGDFVLMLYGAMGSPGVTDFAIFDDVSVSDYYYEAISWANSAGIVTGMGDGTFGAQNSITREQALLILYKAYGVVGYEIPVSALSNLSAYSDAGDISTYALLGLAGLSGQGVITDDTTTKLYPKAALTREAMAQFLCEMLQFDGVKVETPTSLSMHPTEIHLLPNQSHTLMPMFEPMGSGGNITWTSSDPSAVKVDSAGIITNVFTGTGQPVVTITGKSGTLTASCIVRCVADGTEVPPVPELNLPFLGSSDSSTGDSGTSGGTDSDTSGGTDSDTSGGTDSDTSGGTDSDTSGGTDSDTSGGTDSDTSGGTDSDSSGGLLTTTSTGVVVGAPGGLNVRKEPSSSGDVIALVAEGTVVTLYGKTTDDWYHIYYQHTDPATGAITNVTGYVMGQFMEEKVIVGTVINAEVGLNLRDGAGTAFPVIVKLPNGSQVAVLQVFPGWYKVQVVVNGEIVVGFLSSDFLEIAS